MQEKTDELYQEYMQETLDSIFKEGSGQEYQVPRFSGDENEMTLEKADNLRQFYTKQIMKEKIIQKNGLENCEFVENFQEGFALICDNSKNKYKYNFVNENGDLISDIWFDWAYSFANGFAIVQREDGKRNYIDKKGKLISDKWFYAANNNFYDGVAAVEVYPGGWRIIDQKGNYVNSEWYSRVGLFHDGYAVVILSDSYEWSVIDTKGKHISDNRYTEVSDFKDGLARVRGMDGKYNVIDTKGNLVLDKWHEYLQVIENGIVKLYSEPEANYRMFHYYNTKSNQIISNFYRSETREKGWHFVKRKDHLWTLLDENFYEISREGYVSFHIYDDYAIVKFQDYTQNYINKKGEILVLSRLEECYPFDEEYGVARIGNMEGKHNFVDTNGKLVSDTWYHEMHFISPNLYKVSNDNKMENYIDSRGNILLDNWARVWFFMEEKNNFYTFELQNGKKTIVYGKKDLGDYQVKKTILGYRCANKEDNFVVKYEPIKIYDSTYVVCLNIKDIYLYNRKNKEYRCIGNINSVEIVDSFLKIKDEIYLMYDGQMIDITNYYNTNIKGKEKYYINSGIKVLDKNDFFIGNEEEIRKRYHEVIEENKRMKEELARIKEREELEELKEKDRQEKENDNVRASTAVLSIIKSVKTLQEIEERKGHKERIKIDAGLFIKTKGSKPHKEINPLYVETGLLKYVDLSLEDFKDAKLSGMDFSGTNINVDPQLLYRDENGIVDLSNCNFEGISFRVSTNFKNVNICGSKFSNDGSFRTFDINENTLAEGIYDDKTTLNGVPIGKLLTEKHNRRV